MAPTWLVAWLGTALDITPDFLFLLFFLAYACALALLAPSYSRMLPIRGTLYSVCSLQSWLSAVPDLVPAGLEARGGTCFDWAPYYRFGCKRWGAFPRMA